MSSQHGVRLASLSSELNAVCQTHSYRKHCPELVGGVSPDLAAARAAATWDLANDAGTEDLVTAATELHQAGADDLAMEELKRIDGSRSDELAPKDQSLPELRLRAELAAARSPSHEVLALWDKALNKTLAQFRSDFPVHDRIGAAGVRSYRCRHIRHVLQLCDSYCAERSGDRGTRLRCRRNAAWRRRTKLSALRKGRSNVRQPCACQCV